MEADEAIELGFLILVEMMDPGIGEIWWWCLAIRDMLDKLG